MTCTLKANGTGDAIDNTTYAGDAQVSWSCQHGSQYQQVKVDVTGGTLTIVGQGMDVHFGHARILKLWITIPEGCGKLPTDQLADPIQIDAKSQQSKLASMWFLEMSGGVALHITFTL